MLLPVRGYAASILSFTLAMQILPVRTAAEEITVFDASCLNQQMSICLGLLKTPTIKASNGSNHTDFGWFFQNTYNDCVSAYQMSTHKSATKFEKDYYKNSWPRGCGRVEMRSARSVADCADVGKTHSTCLKKVNFLSAADVQLARESFTAQLDAWLKMLENAGAVDLGQAPAAIAGASTPPAPAN